MEKTKIKFEIELDVKLFSDMAARALASYSREGEAVYEVIRRQVFEWACAQDFSELIARIAREKLHSTIQKIVDTELRKVVQRRTKSMLSDGTLFPDPMK